MVKTYSALCIEVRNKLLAADISSAALEAREIVCGAAQKSRDEFYRDMGLYASQAVQEQVAWLLHRRLQGEPVAYLTGRWEFYGIDLEINSMVLVPRVDTEILAQEAIRLLESRPARVLDLCCGSGCIGLAIAANAKNSTVVLADFSPDALAVSERNIEINGLGGRVRTLRADAHRPPINMPWAFDMLVCNPPYIPDWQLDLLEPSVRNYEPRCALLGGEDGLDFYPDICSKWKRVLKRGAHVLFECGIGQAPYVSSIMERNGYEVLQILSDTGGIDRVIVGTID